MMHRPSPTSGERPQASRRALCLPGLLVAVGAALATAHGLYEVARAAAVPSVIAALYPLITDGLALVAHAPTARLTGGARRYAWAVVVLAAGLSGLAQASYLAEGMASAPPWLRFGIGAWPALAAAIVAHLLYLIAADQPPAEPSTGRPDVQPSATVQPSDAVQREPVQRPAEQPAPVQPEARPAEAAGQRSAARVQPRPALPSARQVESPARDRADRAARKYAAQHSSLPTVSQLMSLADVSRGTAGEVLKALRSQPTPLHLVSDHDQPKAQP